MTDKISKETQGLIKNIFDNNTNNLEKLTDITSADLTGGTDNAVNTINEIKSLLLQLINKGKEN